MLECRVSSILQLNTGTVNSDIRVEDACNSCYNKVGTHFIKQLVNNHADILVIYNIVLIFATY